MALISRIACVRFSVARRRDFRLRKSMVAVAVSLLIGAALVGEVGASDDNLIVPGVRIGPVTLGSTVADIVKALGRPDRQRRSTFRGKNHDSDEVSYGYTAYCLWFTWEDKGLRPKVLDTDGSRGIRVTCSRWQIKTQDGKDGIGVGSSIEQVLKAMGGEPTTVDNCKTDRPECILKYKSGVWFRTRNRYSPVYEINVVKPTP